MKKNNNNKNNNCNLFQATDQSLALLASPAPSLTSQHWQQQQQKTIKQKQHKQLTNLRPSCQAQRPTQLGSGAIVGKPSCRHCLQKAATFEHMKKSDTKTCLKVNRGVCLPSEWHNEVCLVSKFPTNSLPPKCIYD